MKRFITLLLAMAALLSACGRQPAAEQTAAPETTEQYQLSSEATGESITDTVIKEESRETAALPDTAEETQPRESETVAPTTQAKPSETVPTPTTPPAEQETTQPTETKPTETKPTETKPTETKPAQPQQPTADKNGLPVLPSEPVYMHVGDTLDLLAGYSGTKTLTWKSNKKAAAEVSAEGVVTAKADGQVTITVSDGKNKATCLVEVRSSLLSFYYNLSVRLQVGESLELQPKYYGNGKLTWHCTDPSVVSVSESGRIVGKKWGNVTVSLTDGRDTCTCQVSVRETDNYLGISAEYPVFVGETLKMKCYYEGSDLRPLQWSSDDPSVLTVDSNGVVTGLKKGEAVVRCTDGDVSTQYTMRVKAQSEKSTELYFHHRIRFYDGVTRFVGDSMRVLVGVKPLGNSEIQLTSSDSSIASVKLDTSSQYSSAYYLNYKVEFKKAGTVRFTMVSSDGCIRETYTVYVKGKYDCDPGKSKLTPGEFSYCATQVGGENGQRISTVLSGYRYHYVKEEDLTWENARKVGESLAKEWYGIRINGILVTYAGWDEERNMHLFYIGY